MKAFLTLGLLLVVASMGSMGSHAFASGSEVINTKESETASEPVPIDNELPDQAPIDDEVPEPSKCESACAKALEAAVQAAEDARDAAYQAADDAYDQAIADAEAAYDIAVSFCGNNMACIFVQSGILADAREAAEEARDDAIGQANRDFQRAISDAADAYDACIAACEDKETPKEPVEQPIRVPVP